MKINTINRKYFSLGELFGYSTSNDDYLSSYNNWDVEYVSSSAENNGVSSMIDAIPSQKWNTLTIARNWSVWTTFYHKNSYCASSDDIRILTPKFNMSSYIWLFLSTIINKESFRFSYGRKLTKDKVLNMKIKLPADESWDPDRDYMENYIKSLHHKPITTKIKSWKYELNIWEWKEFRIWDIFTQDRWKESAPNQNLDWETPIVNETDNNNWITRNVEPTKIFKWNAITISINVWYNVFYQPYDFCASVNIAILKSKYLNKYNWLFIVSLIKHNNKRYSYWYKTSKDKINDMIIKLPVDKNWNPDREFMENYIKNLPYWDRI